MEKAGDEIVHIKTADGDAAAFQHDQSCHKF